MGVVCTSSKNKISEHHQHMKLVKTQSAQNPSKYRKTAMIVIGYIRQILRKFQFNLNMSILPPDIKNLCTLYFSSIFKDIVVERHSSLRLYDIHSKPLEYASILIKKNATLTVNKWSNKTQSGGSLNIVCYGNITLEEGASINLNGKGFCGGNHGRNGTSYHSTSHSSKSRLACGGGGGAGQISLDGEYGAISSYGAGGGYGSAGSDGKYVDEFDKTHTTYGIGGGMYGDKELSTLHLGSGGGAGYRFVDLDNSLRAEKGGSGGGALKLKCFGSILMKSGAKICCDGNKGKSEVSGCGSGGSIHVIVGNKHRLKMEENSCISAVGGLSKCDFGSGGDGRIRIRYLQKRADPDPGYFHDITPKPYIG